MLSSKNLLKINSIKTLHIVTSVICLRFEGSMQYVRYLKSISRQEPLSFEQHRNVTAPTFWISQCSPRTANEGLYSYSSCSISLGYCKQAVQQHIYLTTKSHCINLETLNFLHCILHNMLHDDKLNRTASHIYLGLILHTKYQEFCEIKLLLCLLKLMEMQLQVKDSICPTISITYINIHTIYKI